MITLLANLIQHYLMGSPGDGIPVPRSHKTWLRRALEVATNHFLFPARFEDAGRLEGPWVR